MVKLFPFTDKRDIVGDIKRKPKKPKSKSTKSKYALVIEDDFGSRKIEYLICTEKKIQELLFKKYIQLKRKAIKSDDCFDVEKSKVRVIEQRKAYKVRLDVGFKLFHRIYYERLENNVTHLVEQYDMHTSHYLGYFDRTKAFKVAVDTALKDPRFSKDTDREEDDEKIRKVFFEKSLQIRFDYWYRCSYEYDEWDESSVVVVAKQIEFKKRK